MPLNPCIEQRIARAGIEAAYVSGPEDRDIRDTTDIENDPRRIDTAEQPVVKRRHERRSLAAGCHVRRAEVAHCQDARPLRYEIGVTYCSV